MSLARETVEPGVERFRLTTWRGSAVGYDVSAYLIDGVLVDTGFPHVASDVRALVREVAPRGVVVTHWHEDHAGSVPALAAMGIPMAMRADCASILRERPSIRPYRHIVWGRTPRLEHEIVPFDPAPLRLLATPGHSPDHQIVWDPARRIVASGDLFLGVKVRVAHAHESPRALVASLRTVAALEPRLLLDAHRGVVRDAAAQLRAKLAWTEETMADIVALASRGVSDRTIVRRLFGTESLVGWVSAGEYSRLSFVRAVLREERGEERPHST